MNEAIQNLKRREIIEEYFSGVDQTGTIKEHLCTDDFVLNYPGRANLSVDDANGLNRSVRQFASEINHVPLQWHFDDEYVIVRMKVSVAGQEALQGECKKPSSPFEMSAITIFRFRDLRICEIWIENDQLGLLLNFDLIEVTQAGEAMMNT